MDFIVHLARAADQTIVISGKAFGIQIKSNEDPLIFGNQAGRDCLYGSSLPFFLGVVDRQNLTLTVYNTLNRLNFYWMLGPARDFILFVDGNRDGIAKPDLRNCTGEIGKAILEIGISEPATSSERSEEISAVQSAMPSEEAPEQ